ncbi:gamma-glutamyltransferase [Nocardioides nanhaiensis]|uniref:Glutathione hydrolase proenzyme n=1 Tax=Nocardioides nanhaiensis TaxID=1476871 RepID=A0ABP8W8U3_9ACTN
MRLPLLLTSLCSTVALTAVTLTTPAGPALADDADSSAASGATTSAPAPRTPPGPAVARGRGGAVASVDPNASAVGLRVLQQGGNAVDAAVATAAALGVTEPYSAGVGGGGYFVYYDAKSRTVRTLDGRETAPSGIRRDAFVDPATGDPYPFTPDLVTSGVAVGVPGTPLTWSTALRRWGSRPLSRLLAPAERLAREGFVVDGTFRQQTLDNQERFEQFTSTRRVYLKGGRAPRVGSVHRNPALARTYRLLARDGVGAFYRGPLARDLVRAVRRPPTVRRATLPVPPGSMTTRDLDRYRVRSPRPTRTEFEGLQVYGMAGSSSGGIGVGEALNILEAAELDDAPVPEVLHHYLEASALAFADRAAYVGDQAFVDVPQRALLSQRFADERACEIDPLQAAEKPVAEGDVAADGVCGPAAAPGVVAEDTENISTTHLSVVDRRGNAVAYTLTIEQTGGSGIVVPGRGFLLNNELTDFSTTYEAGDPNRIQPGKRPRSSMSPTIVLDDADRPVLVVGSPGGSTIITTVLQVLVNRLLLDQPLPRAVFAPRASQRNTADVTAEQAFIDRYGDALTALGHTLVPAGDGLTSDPFIGAVAAVERAPGGRLTAVAERERRGGGAARVVRRDARDAGAAD